jgi:ABC-2 type transport system permease protein
MKNVLTVAKYTFIEVYRSKLMMSIGFIGLGLIILCYVASEFAFGAPAKIALDVGLGILSLSNVAIAILIGSTLIAREIEQKTLYMILSRPISRSSFLFGKIAGLSSVLLLNSILLGAISSSLYLYFEGHFQNLVLWVIYFSFLEAFVVLIFATLFSLLTNTTLSVIYTVGIYIVGHAINETSKILFAKSSVIISTVLKLAYLIIPNFYRLNLKDFVIYQQSVSNEFLINTHIYVVLYLIALMTTVNLVFKNKNLD